MAFFKKADELNNRLFMQESGTKSGLEDGEVDDGDIGWDDQDIDVIMDSPGNDLEGRYNENGGSNKRRKVSEDASVKACSPPPPDDSEDTILKAPSKDIALVANGRRRAGPFLDDSESETEDADISLQRRGMDLLRESSIRPENSKPLEDTIAANSVAEATFLSDNKSLHLGTETVSQMDSLDFDGFEGLQDDDFFEGEEYDERRYMEEQRRLEMEEAGFDRDFDDAEALPMFPEDDDLMNAETSGELDNSKPSCPICGFTLDGLSDQEASAHVNACLDGDTQQVPSPTALENEKAKPTSNGSKIFKRPLQPARAGQANPFKLGEAGAQPRSAFSRLMAGHAEDAAWATAAASEHAARGKPSYQRTCPFYKILPGFHICVDAFRYGDVKGQNAYFLSHFHSDHYVGLTARWSHGPIYCSKVTGNLVRQQLGVDPKLVVDLEFEKKTEIPGTEGAHVTMIPANHCPGSSLFLFEKEIGNGKNSRLQRVLHCGDFRACQAHIEHPLLKPEVIDMVTGKSRQQKLDVCYLDTTYLNPKYAFPPQQQVIQACADMCVSLNKEQIDETDGWEKMKKDRAGEGMVKFVRRESNTKQQEEGEDANDNAEVEATKFGSAKQRGRLLVVVGTYSIGKERICVGIAKALSSKIYASQGKQRICHALEDPELDALLTSNPHEAQVHMTPLFEIRAQTLDDYLGDYRDHFSRAVGFRPSGWNYRPPNNRFTESPSVQTVLHSKNWKSEFTMKDLKSQQGSTSRASCYGVPYSEHSSFRELTMFCCALRIDKIIPTVNVGSAKSREKMKAWCEKWATEKKKNGLFRLKEDGSGW